MIVLECDILWTYLNCFPENVIFKKICNFNIVNINYYYYYYTVLNCSHWDCFDFLAFDRMRALSPGSSNFTFKGLFFNSHGRPKRPVIFMLMSVRWISFNSDSVVLLSSAAVFPAFPGMPVILMLALRFSLSIVLIESAGAHLKPSWSLTS